jgi:preprotein translocase subunit SecD
MLNTYSLWKYLLVLGVLSLGLFYAAPNLYAPDPAIQITGESSSLLINESTLRRARSALDEANIEYFGETISADERNGLIRLRDADAQLRAQSSVARALGDGYIIALNLASTTPDWLSDYGAQPMKLGLDLSGGVHFKLEVDVDTAIERRIEFYINTIKRSLREERIRGFVSLAADGRVEMRFKTEESRDKARGIVAGKLRELVLDGVTAQDSWKLYAAMPDATRKEIADYAVTQNLTTLRNRVNELGVSEPLVQRQGQNRIVVELPGIQDTAEAKRILGKVANLEFRMVAKINADASDKQRFEYRSADRAGMSEWLEREVIVTGEQVTNAQAGFDQNGQPNVSISLSSEGGLMMSRVTRMNVKRRMGVLFIERKYRTRYELQEDGSELAVRKPYDEKKEERTVGPSLGAENIRLGVKSVQYGLALVVLFMVLYYRVFGIAAVIALSFNIILLVAFMSIIGATLTLPGIAGIVLTVGMAVDANVLIFSRIREELRNGLSPQMAIHSGFERAVATILDANITTLIVALILYAVGTGPIKGFAVTLSIGILTSMFTAIVGTRAMVNLMYGGRRVEKLSIGGRLAA